MKIGIFGTGYVGLVSGIGFAELGHEVICVDTDQKKIEKLQQGKPVIYEVGLTDLLKKNLKAKRIHFTTEARYAIENAEILFLALPTPSLEDGSVNVSHLHSVARTIGQNMKEYKIIVNKSTAPVGTLKALAQTIRKETPVLFDMVSNPEFLKEGAAFDDFLRPDRIVIGSESKKATEQMKQLYNPLTRNGHPILIMDIASAELTKYAANSMLATRISFMNQIANLCDTLGADIEYVRQGLMKDSRIGDKFLYAGLGYGGSCFPKDMRALIHMGRTQGVDLSILEAVDTCNTNQRSLFVHKIKNHFGNSIKGKTFTVWGIAFKPQTDDVREAPALTVIKSLIAEGAKIRAHDPVAIERAQTMAPQEVIFETDPYVAAKGADALLIITEWSSYRNPDYEKLKAVMKEYTVFDGRNVLDKNKLITHGFSYYSIGRNIKK